jgi:hypothetical protein
VDCLPVNEFTDSSGALRIVNSVFQIWERRDEARIEPTPPGTHIDFNLRHAHLSRTPPDQLAALRKNYPFAIPQVGSNFAPRDPNDLARGSWWFVQPSQAGVDGDRLRTVFETLDFRFLDGMNTAHKSLARADIVQAYLNAVGGFR